VRSLLILLSLLVSGCGRISQGQIQKYQALHAQDLIVLYEQARKSSDKLDMCVKAKLVAIAYNEAGASGEAHAWKAREVSDCQLAYDQLTAVEVQSTAKRRTQ
jgi:hypothetical protein